MNKAEVYAFLEKEQIPFETTDHAPMFTLDEMIKSGLPYPEQIAKNLFVRDAKKRNYYLITVREAKRVDLKAFQQAHGTTRLSFASEEDLMAILGLTKGSVSPFGLLQETAKQVTFYLDKDFAGEIMGIHPNLNDATVWLKAEVLTALLEKYGHETNWVEL